MVQKQLSVIFTIIVIINGKSVQDKSELQVNKICISKVVTTTIDTYFLISFVTASKPKTKRNKTNFCTLPSLKQSRKK